MPIGWRRPQWKAPVEGSPFLRESAQPKSTVNHRNVVVNRLKTVLMALTLFTAASLTMVADDAKDQVRQTAAVHEFQITSRKY